MLSFIDTVLKLNVILTSQEITHGALAVACSLRGYAVL